MGLAQRPPGQLRTSWAVHSTSPCGPYAQRHSPEWPPRISASYLQRFLSTSWLGSATSPGILICRAPSAVLPPAEVEWMQMGLQGHVSGRHLPLDVCQTQSTPPSAVLEKGRFGVSTGPAWALPMAAMSPLQVRPGPPELCSSQLPSEMRAEPPPL